MDENDNVPLEVAIVGGGCAGITTAFELSRPEHQGKFHITVYQQGWRLGGKGASGRGVSGRIEEHGLHLWMGFYENAFQLLRECYAELGRDPATHSIARFEDAFARDPFVGIADLCADGKWRPWTADFPSDDTTPGDPLSENNPFTVASYLQRSTELLGVIFSSLSSRQSEHFSPSPHDTAPHAATTAPQILLDTIGRLLKVGGVVSLAGLLEAIQLLGMSFGKIPLLPSKLTQQLLDLIRKNAHLLIENIIATDDESRRLWEMADIILACIQGAISFELATHPDGFDSIDDYDWREWLVLNGASESSVNSAFMRGIYDLLFAYEGGDTSNPRMSAGQALRGAVRMFFSSRGSIFWKMTAGMGDVVFAPFYEVLKQRGVSFEFFHRLDNIALVDEATLKPGELPYVEELQFSMQAMFKNKHMYDPLVQLKGLPVWPSKPIFEQLLDGETLKSENRDFESDWDKRYVAKKTLKVQQDFDFVVLAVGLGAVPGICSELITRNKRWQDMVTHLGTVSTQAMQLWMREDMSSLGWDSPPINLSGFITPFDTWADMTHLTLMENWPQAPASIAYFCSVLPELEGGITLEDPSYPGHRADEVRNNSTHFLNNHIQEFWPKAVDSSGKFRWEILIDSEKPNGGDESGATEASFDSQFWKANVNASDRYVLSLPGTSKYRISPLDMSYDNLTIAGDWTSCSHNAGCVEAAMMSGRLAAHALSGYPALEDIIGFDHP
ncbi:MAG: hypothetical protein ACJA0Z_001149 [Halioglobus sp.]|jgi:uncharacterized protein with NAD-binding domain and iron-sulfur cluster